MTTLAPSPRRLVLADRVLPRSLVMDIALVAAGAALVALLAQITIPLPLVPITGQTLAVLLVGSTLGWARGALSMVLYAVLGLVGLPVFAPNADGSHSQGVSVVFGATGGYIIGFILSAILVGWLAELKWDRKFLKALATFAAGTLSVFVIGLPWLGFVAHLDIPTTLAYGLYPFLIPGAIKAVIAAGLLPLAWFGANKLAKRRGTDS
jgi:biotin transport system substrate-specific component